MYPGTMVNWYDQSASRESNVDNIDNSQLFFQVSSFDRGPEDLRVLSGKSFYDLYGSRMNFARHGQPALQAANIIDGGGQLLVKRVVAEDALLANVVAVASVQASVNAVKAQAGDINGKTLEEIITGKPAEPVTYAEELTIESAVGSTDNATILAVTPTLTGGYKYYYKEAETDVLPKAGELVDLSLYTAWDGASEVNIINGTKIQVIEYEDTAGIKSCGVITVVSKIPHPATTSIAPNNGLNALFITSNEGTTVGNTALKTSPAINPGNKYYYKIVTDTTLAFPDPSVPITEVNFTGWTEWDGVSELSLADKTKIVLIEFEIDDNDPIAKTYTPVKGASIDVVSKLPDDNRTSDSITMIVPSADKYIVNFQENSVKWNAVSISNCKTVEEVVEEAEKLYKVNNPSVTVLDDGSIDILSITDYPMFVAADNGRGVSSKSIKISPDYTTSKDMDNMFYNLSIFEGTSSLETIMCTLNPSTVYNNVLYGLNLDSSIQIKFVPIDNMYELYMENLSELTGYTIDALAKFDCLYMTNNKGAAIPYIKLDENSVDFGTAYGVELQGGSNGAFGDAPFGTEAWTKAVVEVFDGTFDDVVWDVDTYRIAAIFDANYPIEVKNAIAKFVTFREDVSYFRDYGISVKSYADIVRYHDDIDYDCRNRYVSDYYTTYQIYDPETKARERVTMMYDLARVMVGHFASGCYKPMAGSANGMILTSAIPGTLNFTPRVTPTVNQKSLLDDMRVNYAIFENDRLVVQSCYTSQEKYTQLSYTNNVAAIQEVVRAVRTSCPKQRFTFTSGSDFSIYADAVNNVLKGFSSNFAELRFEYEQNSLKAANKIFYACIYFRFNNWAQTEVFDIFALPNE